MLTSLWQQAREKHVLADIDIQLAQCLTADLPAATQAPLQVMIAWLSSETRQGHVCVVPDLLSPLTLFQGSELVLAETIWLQIGAPSAQDWSVLFASTDLISDGQRATPLVYQHQKLYFQRLWQDEVCVADYFSSQSQRADRPDLARIAPLLDSLFPPVENLNDIDWQKVAVALAVTRQAAIISGGPGTGKTTTVAKLLATLVMLGQGDSSGRAPRIRLAAPTGKAAARLTESLNQAMSKLALPAEALAAIPQEALTLHRLLGAKKQSRFFVHHAQNPLHLDVLVIDEASMVDLSLMASVLEALPPHAWLILLGDREQLASVESGSILGDICAFADYGYSAKTAALLSDLTGFALSGQAKVPPVSDMIALLKKSYRFDAKSGIGQLAQAIFQRQRAQIESVLQGQFPDVRYYSLDNSAEYQQLMEICVAGYRGYLSQIATENPAQILADFGRFQLLCALRHGDFGVSGLNQRIEHDLAKLGLIQMSAYSPWYVGRPVMIRRNNHELGLFNGDIGMTLRDPITHQMAVYFRLADGSVKGISPNRLPAHDTAFAMTVHQSQGSEFEHVVFAMPDQYSPVLTRQLVYTAVTRAKQQLTLMAKKSLLFKAIETNKQRESGLVQRLSDFG